MRENFTPVEDSFRNGLWPDDRLPANHRWLEKCLGLKASEFGLVPHTPTDWPDLSTDEVEPPPVSSPVPVITVAGAPWFEERRASGAYGTWTLKKGMAPLSVYFEGWESQPREKIVDWQWDFGDGSPVKHGFNVGHIYETPGTYTVTLTVTAKDGGFASTTTSVEVLARTGRVFTVDAVSGSDANDGINAPWRTATKAFSGMNTGFYQPGDDIVFARGQTFDLDPGVVTPGHYKAGYGYRFRAADGPGDLPVIQRSGGSGKLIALTGHNHDFITFQDLVFDNVTKTNGYDCIEQVGRFQNLTFLRVEIKNAYRSLPCYGYLDDNQSWSGLFVHGCHFHDSGNVHLYLVGRRISVRDSIFADAGNHCCYGDWEQSASFLDSEFVRPSQGRRCWRVAAETGGHSVPSRDVYVRDCVFEGGLDAELGRYTLCLAEVAPNTNTPQTIQDVLIEYCTFKDGEQLFRAMSCDRVEVRYCTFLTDDAYESAQRIFVGAQWFGGAYQGGTFEKRPVRDFALHHCTVEVNGDLAGSNKTRVFAVNHYGYGLVFDGLTKHTNIRFYENDVTIKNEWGYAFEIVDGSPEQLAEIHTGNTWTGIDRDTQETVLAGGTPYTLDAWFALTGNEDPAGWSEEVEGTPKSLPTPEWPFPQLALGRTVSFLGYEDELWTVDPATWKAKSVTPYRAAHTGGVPVGSEVAAGGVWHFALFDDVAFAANGTCLYLRTPHIADGYRDFVGTQAVPQTVCRAGNLLVAAGFAGPRFTQPEWVDAWNLFKATAGPAVVSEDSTFDGGWLLFADPGASDFPFAIEMALLGYPADGTWEKVRGLFAERIQSGACGFVRTERLGKILRVEPLGAGVGVYGENGVGYWSRETGFRAWLDTGVKGRGAVCGDGKVNYFLTADGCLYRATAEAPQKLGYPHILSTLSDPVLSYDPEEREAYIADGAACYVLRPSTEGYALSQKSSRPSTLARYDGELLAYEYGADDGTFDVLTGQIDHKHRGLKTFVCAIVGYEDITDLTVRALYRYETTEDFADDLDPVPVNVDGAAYSGITARDYKVRLTGKRRQYARLQDCTVRWKLVGIVNERGLYEQGG